jgi:CheY-like chemotaxis protein
MAMAHVLVVEDDEAIRESLRDLLEDTDHTMSEVATGEAALEVLRNTTQRFVVLLDLILPGMDGASVLRTVCADPHLSSQHAYLVVSAGSTRDFEQAEPLLAVLHGQLVPKPFDVETLLGAIAAAELQLNGTAT